MKHLALIIVCSTVFLTSSLPSFGWGDWGHMTVAEIAYSRLNAHAKQQVDALIQAHVPPFTKTYKGKTYTIDPAKTATFVTAACWPDDIKSNSDRRWHYIDIPYVLDEVEIHGGDGSGSDVVQQLGVCVQTLRKTNGAKTEKARRLRYLIHFVGDIHQPLHCAELVSLKHPHGDTGGNDFEIKGTDDNLHSLWDHGVGMFPSSRPKRPLSSANKAKVQAFAEGCTQPNPESGMGSEAKNFNFQEWADDSHELAVQYSYNLKENTEPKPGYVTDSQEVVRKQIALAGYRLANLLNGIWK